MVFLEVKEYMFTNKNLNFFVTSVCACLPVWNYSGSCCSAVHGAVAVQWNFTLMFNHA